MATGFRCRQAKASHAGTSGPHTPSYGILIFEADLWPLRSATNGGGLLPATDALAGDLIRFAKLFTDEIWAQVFNPGSGQIGTKYFKALARSDRRWNRGAPLPIGTRKQVGCNTAFQGLYRRSQLTRRQIAIPAASLATLKTRQRHTGIIWRIECFHHGLTTTANPPPVAHQGRASEQSELYRQAIETPHVLFRIDATKMDRLGIDHVHARSLAYVGGAVQ